MSLDELRDDLKRNMAEARTLTSVEQVRDHLVNTLWPFIEANIDVVDEIDDAVAELVDQQEDYLQPETAAIFAAVVQSSLQLAAELRKRSGNDPMLGKLVANHEQLCAQAVEVLGAVTMMPADEEEEEGDDETQADATTDGGSNE
jgi:CHASE3 domain sensor protein